MAETRRRDSPRTGLASPVWNSIWGFSRRVRGSPPVRRRLHFGTPEFDAASQFAVRASSTGWFLAAVWALTKRGRFARAVWAVIRLPIVTVRVTKTEDEAWRGPCFPPAARSIFQGHVGQGVLDLDEDDDEYLDGHQKRQLRTRLRGAQRKGVKPVQFDSYEEWFPMAVRVLTDRPGGPEEIARMSAPGPSQRMGYYAAVSAWGHAVALGGVAIFGDTAVLFSLVSRPGESTSGDARYLLHTFMRSNLRAEGIRRIIAGSGLLLAEGLQLFQDLLGYELRNLVIVREHQAGVSGATLCPNR